MLCERSQNRGRGTTPVDGDSVKTTSTPKLEPDRTPGVRDGRIHGAVYGIAVLDW